MVVTLSSKGQLVIPKNVRQTLALKPGAKFEVEVDEQNIVLKPVADKPSFEAAIESLYGKFAGQGLLDLLEEEHRWEIARDNERCA